MEAITCYCLECNHKLGRFRNSWDMIGTNYYSPIYPTLTHENGFTGSGEVRMADFGPSDMECFLQDIACKKCNKFLGIRCDNAPEGHNLWTNQILLRLSNTKCLVDGTGQPANISVVNRLPLLPQQPSRESSKKPKRRASTAQPSSSGTKKASNVQPRNVRGQSQASAGLMLPPPLPLAKTSAQKPEEFQDWAERAIKSQQQDIDRLSGAVQRIEGTVEAMRKLIEELRSDRIESYANGVSHQLVGTNSEYSPRRQSALHESAHRSNIPDSALKKAQKRKRATSGEMQKSKPGAAAALQQLPRSKKSRLSASSVIGSSRGNRERSMVETPASGQSNSTINPIQASQSIRASCPPVWNTKTPDSGMNGNQMEQSILPSRKPHSPANSLSSPIPLYDQDLIITGKRQGGRDKYYGKVRDSEGNLIRPSGKVDGRSLRGKKASIGKSQDAETAEASSNARGQTRDGESNAEANSNETPRNDGTRPEQVYPTVENQTPRPRDSILGRSKESMTPIRRSASPDELGSDTVYDSPRDRAAQRFTAPPSILRAQFTPAMHGMKEPVQTPVFPSINKDLAVTTPTHRTPAPISETATHRGDAQKTGQSTEGETKPFSCGVCKKRYGSLRGLKYHKEHVPGCEESADDEHPDVTCAVCHRSYYNIYSLARHVCRVTPNSSPSVADSSLVRNLSNPAPEKSKTPRDQSLRRSIVSSVKQSGAGSITGNVKAPENNPTTTKETDTEEARKKTIAARERLVRETMERELGTSLGDGGFTIES